MGSVLIEEDVAALVVVHTCEALHEVTQLLPLIIVTLEEVSAVLNGHDYGAAVADFGLGGQRQEYACTEGEDRGDGGLRRGFFFVVAEGAGIEDAVSSGIVLDGLVAQVDGGLGGPRCKFGSVFVEVV